MFFSASDKPKHTHSTNFQLMSPHASVTAGYSMVSKTEGQQSVFHQYMKERGAETR